eukprot:17131-Heterococcus_DN1.PRE.1
MAQLCTKIVVCSSNFHERRAAAARKTLDVPAPFRTAAAYAAQHYSSSNATTAAVAASTVPTPHTHITVRCSPALAHSASTIVTSICTTAALASDLYIADTHSKAPGSHYHV